MAIALTQGSEDKHLLGLQWPLTHVHDIQTLSAGSSPPVGHDGRRRPQTLAATGSQPSDFPASCLPAPV